MSHRYDVDRYVDNVLTGKFIAGQHVKWACERYLDDIKECEHREIYIHDDIANYAIDCFSDFKHTTGQHKGNSFELYLFQKFIIWNLWGWRRRSNDLRRFRTAFVSLARGNGKSPFAAAIANILAFADIPEEHRAQVFTFATKEAQARIVWDECLEQLNTNISWRSAVDPYRASIRHRENGSVLEPKGSDSQGSDGWNLHGAVIDELHAWTRFHGKLFSKVRTALSKREQPLLVIISTEGDDQSLLYIQQRNYAEQIVCPESKITDDSYFAYIASADQFRSCTHCVEGKECDVCGGSEKEEIPIDDESYWPQANPMLCETSTVVQVDGIRDLCKQAKVNPTVTLEVRQYHLNQRVTSSTKLFSPELWARGNTAIRDLDGKECCLGFDWGWRDDLTALAGVFPDGKGSYDFKSWVWIPRECPYNLSEEPWASWIASGELRVTEGDTTDTKAIYKCIEDEVMHKYQVQGIAFDGNNAREFGSWCVDQFGKEHVYAFPQKCTKYNEPIRLLLSLLSKSQVRHGGHSLLSWCANNAIAQTDSSGYMMPSKEKSLSKIDPICAVLMALSEATFNKPKPEPNWSFDALYG